MEIDDLPVTTERSRRVLSERQLVDYRGHREQFLEWLLHFGKDPKKAEGYSTSTAENTAYRTDRFYRWVWDHEGGYTLNLSTDQADAYMKHLATENNSGHHKETEQRSLKRLFKWRHLELGGDEWDPEFTFSGGKPSQPRDYLTVEERMKVREAALEYGAVPSYSDLSPEKRDEWKSHLAQRFQKPKSEVTPKDFERANGWKFTSMTWTSLDAGLRPIEVGRAKEHWVDVDNQVLRIPAEESSKNEDNWIVSLSERTTIALSRWLEERKMYEKYDGTDTLWLTREGNPYGAASLRYLIHNLCDIAGIPIENRSMSWYTLRHSVGTYMTREEGLAAAQAQLRHKSEHTTMKYDNAPVEDRRDALDRMG